MFAYVFFLILVFKNSDKEQTSESGDTSSEICSKNTHNNNNKQDIAQARPATTDKSPVHQP